MTKTAQTTRKPARKLVARYEKGTRGRCRNSTSVARCNTRDVYTPQEEQFLQAVKAHKDRTGMWPCSVEIFHIVVDQLGYKR
jgi:hypothetical protein